MALSKAWAWPRWLVVEKMVERGGERLLDILRVDDGAIADRFGEIILAQSP
jgi:hypothetical protein